MTNIQIVSKIITCIRLLKNMKMEILRSVPDNDFYDTLGTILDHEILRLTQLSTIISSKDEFYKILYNLSPRTPPSGL